MRIFVLDPGLIGMTGHHYNVAMGYQREAARRGIDIRFYGNRAADDAVLSALNARPVFRHGPYEVVSTDKLCGPLDDVIDVGAEFADTCGALVDDGVAADDLVVVPTTTQNEVHGCALWLQSLSSGRRPRLALSFSFENYMRPPDYREHDTRTVLAYRFAAKRLVKVAPDDRRLILAQSLVIAERLAKIMLAEVRVCPMPHDYVLTSAAGKEGPRKSAGNRPVVAVIGHSRRDKGFHLIPEIVRRCAALGGGLNFFVQISPAGAEAIWGEAAADMRGRTNVELHVGEMDEYAYADRMSRCDIVLFPYDPNRFSGQTSGIFAEALATGKVVVVPSGTWMSDHLENGFGAGVVYRGQAVEHIAAAVLDAARAQSKLSAKAIADARRWREAQCTSRFFDLMLGGLGVA